jgi:hypothetical protein
MATPQRVRFLGVSILIVGLITAAKIYQLRASEDDSPYTTDDFVSKRDLDQIERIGGKANVLAIELNSWLVSLWHGKRLAYSIASLSVGGFIGCYLLANFLTDSSVAPEEKDVQ